MGEERSGSANRVRFKVRVARGRVVQGVEVESVYQDVTLSRI